MNGAVLRGERSGACARSRSRRCVLRLWGRSRLCVLQLWCGSGVGLGNAFCGCWVGLGGAFCGGGAVSVVRSTAAEPRVGCRPGREGFSCAGFCARFSLRAVFCGKYSARRILSKVTTEERRGCGDRSGGGAATRKGLSECSDSPFSAERSDGGCAAAIVCDYNRGPAATSALPSSLPVNLVKFFTKRLARSTAFVFHSSAFL